MNWIVAIPIEWRLAVVLVAGAFFGVAANWAAQRLAWEPRAARRWFEIRPLLVVFFFAAGEAALYWWEIDQAGLLPRDVPAILLPDLAADLHAQWLCHTILVWLMLVASLIDADEKLIPDEITVPGTLFGLLTAACYPFAMLPVLWLLPKDRLAVGFLHVTSPHPWPAWLQGFPHAGSLAIALALWWLWCVALMDRVWRAHWGWSWAIRVFCAHLVRSPATWRLGALGLAGSPLIAGVWFWGNDDAWRALLTSLIGMAAGGGLIWMVRIVAAVVLKREAMGFGDVTLMAMIGSVLGWQSCLVIFFLAPFAGIFLGLLQLVLRRENEIPYGPFLSLATVGLIVAWCPIWSWLELTLLLLGGLVPLFVILCFPAMAFILYFWRLLRDSFG